MLFSCAVQVPHRALRTRPLCIPLLVVRPAVYCYVSPPRKRGVGGAEEARTPDPLLAKEVLSQLSYGPPVRVAGGKKGDAGTRVPTSDFPLPSTKKWWGILDSNQRPQSYQDCALTS